MYGDNTSKYVDSNKLFQQLILQVFQKIITSNNSYKQLSFQLKECIYNKGFGYHVIFFITILCFQQFLSVYLFIQNMCKLNVQLTNKHLRIRFLAFFSKKQNVSQQFVFFAQ
eukprot:TRINITY_DN103_c3_g1_i1.p3 TRINITY_DN103_c3_g1~~TRINITY_DN103_c3_g1_i1.p3  ORF type:complete len:112 (-),score=0.43 TRINITY_DN103_c3_g1_i1:300-635(-)